MNAIAANTSTIPLRETVIEVKPIPIGDKPRNKPSKPAKPKLSATDSTSVSTKSSLFLPKNRMFTKQYPGRNTTKMKAKKYRGISSAESCWLLGRK